MSAVLPTSTSIWVVLISMRRVESVIVKMKLGWCSVVEE